MGAHDVLQPAGYANKHRLLRRFAERVRGQGLRLVVVELAFGERPFEIPDDVADIVDRRRTTAVLWQKERLLNLGLAALPESCDKVAWLDADVHFDRDDWVVETARRLEEYVVVQPFDTAYWMPQHVTPSSLPDSWGFGNREGDSMPSMGAAMSRAEDDRKALESYYTHGHTGFGWSARRHVLDRHGFYDRQILGNGDFIMAHAMFGNEDFWQGRNWECDRLSPALMASIEAWGRAFYADVGGSVSFTPGNVYHYWHGNQSDRMYDQRLDVLKETDFDPERDLALDAAGCWRWSSDKPELHAWADRYFHARKEE